MKKIGFIILFGLITWAFGETFTLTAKEAQTPKTAVSQVLKVFKEEVKMPTSSIIIKIPYNINYSIDLNKKTYFVAEYKIKVIYKLVKDSFTTDEKNYIIRFIVDVESKKVKKIEIYSLVKTKIFQINNQKK